MRRHAKQGWSKTAKITEILSFTSHLLHFFLFEDHVGKNSQLFLTPILFINNLLYKELSIISTAVQNGAIALLYHIRDFISIFETSWPTRTSVNMVKFSYKKARGWIMLSSRCPWIQESKKVMEKGCRRTVAQAVKWDKRKSSCRYNCFVTIYCLEGNVLYTQPLVLSCIWTQLPYGHELSIVPNLSRNLKTRQCFWREASFPKEKYCTHPHVHIERCPGKNAHYSDTSFEQTAPQSLVE